MGILLYETYRQELKYICTNFISMLPKFCCNAPSAAENHRLILLSVGGIETPIEFRFCQRQRISDPFQMFSIREQLLLVIFNRPVALCFELEYIVTSRTSPVTSRCQMKDWSAAFSLGHTRTEGTSLGYRMYLA